ncbi:MAG: glycerophosphodiester phosphodiesterase family protein [Bacteroidia bacterium]|nr:hypothetical protein [Bacteroidia bacterium]MDW8158619.1 glycerophosphodiester phosphodiesterase family protein [Bacteroidia bacterium]
MYKLFSILLLTIVGFIKSWAQPIVVAHRGGALLAPENTMAAFYSALSLGCKYIELDVHFTLDSQFVVIHDPYLKRTAGFDGRVQKMKAGEIVKLGAGAHFHSGFSSERVPLLDSVLVALRGKAIILLEVKPQRANSTLVVQKLVEKLEFYNFTDHCLVLSFDDCILKEVKRKAPYLACIKLITGKLPLLGWVIDLKLRPWHWEKSIQGCVGVGWNYRALNKRLVNKLKNHKLQVYCWTVNDEKAIKKIKGWGIDGIITDDPQLAQVILEK